MNFIPIVTALGVLLTAAPALAASTLVGDWKTPEKNGVVRIYECGAALCGKVVAGDDLTAHPDATDVKNKDASLRSRPMKGLVIFSGLTGGPKEYKGALLYNPADGGAYHGAITMVDDNTLKLTGCVVFPFCQTQVWHRAN